MSTSLRSRRFFLQLITYGGGAALLAACTSSGSSTTVVPSGGSTRFPQGVFSGDPTATSAVLSTRVLPAGNPETISLKLQVAANQTFSPVLQETTLTARLNAGRNFRTEPGDYIARQVVTNLPSRQALFYRFITNDGSTSPVGQFRTLPAPGDSNPIKFLHISLSFCISVVPTSHLFGLVRQCCKSLM